MLHDFISQFTHFGLPHFRQLIRIPASAGFWGRIVEPCVASSLEFVLEFLVLCARRHFVSINSCGFSVDACLPDPSAFYGTCSGETLGAVQILPDLPLETATQANLLRSAPVSTSASASEMPSSMRSSLTSVGTEIPGRIN